MRTQVEVDYLPGDSALVVEINQHGIVTDVQLGANVVLYNVKWFNQGVRQSDWFRKQELQ